MVAISMLSARSFERSAGAYYVGVVSGWRTVRFVAVAPSRERLDEQLAGYVESQLDSQLFPEDAERVLELLRQQQQRAAIELYLSRVGRRWDQEWLTVTTVPVADSMAAPNIVDAGVGTSRPFLGVL